MKVVVAPDSFGGTLSARAAGAAIVEGWREARPDDNLELVPLSDGGEGLLDVLATAEDTWMTAEVAGPLGRPVEAQLLLRPDRSAVVESAEACGLTRLDSAERDPAQATSYGVGELLDAARETGARKIVVGLGGSATVDGGAGALSGLGFQLTVADGSGLKVGGGELHRIVRADRGWSSDWSGVEVQLLADVPTVLADAARVFGPQKGASEQDVDALTAGLERWADVAERDLAGGRPLRNKPGSGAAGGLGFGLACGIGARFEEGSRVVAELQGLATAMLGADLVVTGEGRLDATSAHGKVVAYVRQAAETAGRPVAAVVGSVGDGAPEMDRLEVASPDGPGADPAADVTEATTRLATSWSR